MIFGNYFGKSKKKKGKKGPLGGKFSTGFSKGGKTDTFFRKAFRKGK
tara:strand:- start:439 stop:579 length:141 start_codon:yes stop_codon:yes gene_type:complete